MKNITIRLDEYIHLLENAIKLREIAENSDFGMKWPNNPYSIKQLEKALEEAKIIKEEKTKS